MHPTIAVVVPMLNASGHVENLLSSLLDQTFDEPWELIVADNGSTDDGVAVVERVLGTLTHPHLVRWEVVHALPRGYATPRNAGAWQSTAPLLAFCDSDDTVDERWLGELVRALGSFPVVASRKLGTSDVAARDQTSIASDQRELPVKLGLVVAHTAGLACRREVFEALGGFDTYFDLGGEDVDFSIRAHVSLGVEPVIVDTAFYWWDRVEEPSRAFSKGYRDGQSLVRLFARHRNELSEPSSGPLNLLRSVARLVRRVPRLRDPVRRRSIAREAGYVTGRAVASAKYRVFYF